MQKTRAAIVGYGNIGKNVLAALQAAPDFEVAGVVRRSSSMQDLPAELQEILVVDHISKLGRVDVAILCLPTRSIPAQAKEILALGINTVDSYDIHASIWELRQELTPVAQAHQSVAIVSAGWDPGSDSVIRALFEAVYPQATTYTNFGPGMSMGHTVAVKAIPGVKKALSMTIPAGKGKHDREVFIELEDGYLFEEVAQKIKNDAYFVKDKTQVTLVEDVDTLINTNHGVHIIRQDETQSDSEYGLEYSMRINNPVLTAQVMVACARATMKAQAGAYTMIEIPVIDMLYGGREELVRKLV